MKGLGAVLLQKPVTYKSRTLTPVDTGYSIIEMELLSVVFGLERLHNYVLQQDQSTDWPQATNTHMEEVNCSS